METLSHFTSVIQLISAVNFANIAFGFHTKVFRILFDIRKTVKATYQPIKEDIIVASDSLKSMEPIETTDGKTTEEEVISLQQAYRELKTKCKKEIDKLYSTCKKFSDTEIVKIFFLFVSLYCIIDLVLIALSSAIKCIIPDTMLHLTNFLTFGFCFKYIIHIIKQNNKVTYKTAIIDTAIILGISIILSIINFIFIEIFYVSFEIPMYAVIISYCLSVLIPFIPCIFCFYYARNKVKQINTNVKDALQILKQESEKLQKRMDNLNSISNIFKRKRNYDFT